MKLKFLIECLLIALVQLAILCMIYSYEPVEVTLIHEAEATTTIPVVLSKIATCESEGKQFNDDGTLLRGKINRLDVGKYQINEYWHLDAATKLGYDIHTEKGNEEYAVHLYHEEGTQPWNASRSCWEKL